MRKFGLSSLAFAAGLLLVCGCSTLKIPSEDLEVADLCADEIAVLRDPKLSPMSREKYEAAKALIAKVDFSYTRETKTLNDILYYGDAAVDNPQSEERTITFNYQYGNSYVRLVFHVWRNFVLRTEVLEK